MKKKKRTINDSSHFYSMSIHLCRSIFSSGNIPFYFEKYSFDTYTIQDYVVVKLENNLVKNHNMDQTQFCCIGHKRRPPMFHPISMQARNVDGELIPDLCNECVIYFFHSRSVRLQEDSKKQTETTCVGFLLNDHICNNLVTEGESKCSDCLRDTILFSSQKTTIFDSEGRLNTSKHNIRPVHVNLGHVCGKKNKTNVYFCSTCRDISYGWSSRVNECTV